MFYLFNKKCTHDKVPPQEDYYYCPDCGELIQNKWYLVRCASCGLKEIATVKNGEIIPQENFCHNCGCKSFKIEPLEKIDCINVNYAVLIKEIVNLNLPEYTQSWSDVIQTPNVQPKLLR